MRRWKELKAITKRSSGVILSDRQTQKSLVVPDCPHTTLLYLQLFFLTDSPADYQVPRPSKRYSPVESQRWQLHTENGFPGILQ